MVTERVGRNNPTHYYGRRYEAVGFNSDQPPTYNLLPPPDKRKGYMNLAFDFLQKYMKQQLGVSNENTSPVHTDTNDDYYKDFVAMKESAHVDKAMELAGYKAPVTEKVDYTKRPF